jgi:cytochrome c peroxidase
MLAGEPTAIRAMRHPAFALALALAIAAGCTADRPSAPSEAVPAKASPALPPRAAPAGELAALGERLFFDRRLSGDNTISCASCHDLARGLSDGRRVPVGVSKRPLRRNAPSLWNLEARAPYFWDGRAATLEEQALGPITDPDEMGQDLKALEAELAADADYRGRFERCFPGEGVSALGIASALAAYERTLVSRSSPYDRYVAGDRGALDGRQVRGLALFEGKAECVTCHRGPDLTDNQFHRVGLAGDDPGRAAVDPASGPAGGFKTPSLREVARSAPYFHDGSVATLEEVVDHYNHGGDPSVGAARDIHPIDLSGDERRDLVAFLRALSSSP